MWLAGLWIARGDTLGEGSARSAEVAQPAFADRCAGNYRGCRWDIWIGTRGDGLYRFSEANCTRFTRQEGLIEFILALYSVRRLLWIRTREGELNRLKDGRFTTYTMREGLIDDVICHITEDDQGHFGLVRAAGFRISREWSVMLRAGRWRCAVLVTPRRGWITQSGMQQRLPAGRLQDARWQAVVSDDQWAGSRRSAQCAGQPASAAGIDRRTLVEEKDRSRSITEPGQWSAKCRDGEFALDHSSGQSAL